MSTSYGGYIKISDAMLSALTDEQESRLYEMLARRYAKQREYQERRGRFNLSAELNWNRSHAPVPVHLLRLRKPILPNRWLNFREGWSKENGGFSSKDLTPEAIHRAFDKMMNEIRDPYFRTAHVVLKPEEGFKLTEVTP